MMRIEIAVPVDNTVDSWGYLSTIVEEHINVSFPCASLGTTGDGGTQGNLRTDLVIYPVVHNPQALRRQQDLSARKTGDL